MINKYFEKLATRRKSYLYVHIYVHTDKNRKNQKKKFIKKKIGGVFRTLSNIRSPFSTKVQA